nr:MAG TPA: major capsid protein [Caudoviricetes sp.]
MPRTGTFGGFSFDPEVFSGYMAEQPTWNDAIINSGILVQDSTIMDLIGEKGNVATLPFYVPIDEAESQALNNDGETDNTPVEISGKKQTAMLIQRMKAWKAQDFTKELTGADPMTHVANSVAGFYRQTRVRDLMAIVDAVLSLKGMENHITDLSEQTGTGAVTDANKVDETTLIFAQQKALGDSAEKMGLLFLHSYMYAKYKALGLVDYNKYTVTNALAGDVNLPSIGGFIPVVSDRFTADTSKQNVVYKTYMIGAGSILTCPKNNYEDPYYADYDPETKAGIRKLYTKQGYVLHPNGFSIDQNKVAKESPTNTELGNKANWSLVYNHKNIRMGMIKSNG